MYLNLPNGTELIFNQAENALSYLKSLKRYEITTSPDKLVIIEDGKTLSLLAEGKSYPIRTTFLRKLLKWFNFPLGQIKYLDVETLVSVMNDYLVNIKSGTVTITIEDDQALTITSERFGKIEDIKLISQLKHLGISKIFKNDFMTSIITESKERIEPFTGDEFGIGISLFNSETGFRAFKINSYLLRYVCSNGAYVSVNTEDKKYYHYDLNVEDIYETINQNIKTLSVKKQQIKEKISLLKNAGDFEETVKKVAEIMRIKIGKNKTDMLLKDIKSIKNNYDLFNHITFRAKEHDISTRIMLEEIAGELLFFN